MDSVLGQVTLPHRVLFCLPCIKEEHQVANTKLQQAFGSMSSK